MNSLLKILAIASIALTFSSCMQQTVRDAQGNIIYQETVSGTPWQSDKRTEQQVETREEELGWR